MYLNEVASCMVAIQSMQCFGLFIHALIYPIPYRAWHFESSMLTLLNCVNTKSIEMPESSVQRSSTTELKDRAVDNPLITSETADI